jgi:PKD repeat protein
MDPDGSIVSYDWDFGDDTTGTGATPSHTYNTDGSYTVTLMVTDNIGTTGEDTTTAAIDQTNRTPIADAGGPYGGAVNVPVTFDGSGSVDPDGGSLLYSWDFADGSSLGSGVKPTHTYTTAGVKNVVLTVTDTAASGLVEVFVTAGAMKGNLGGLAGADATCTAAATAAGLAGTWTAWLSDSTTNAKDRILDAEYRRLDGTVVANDLADLTDGTLDAAINRDENGAAVSSNPWTGTQSDGIGTAETCSDWTDSKNSSQGAQGDTDNTDGTWTQLGSTAPCDFNRRLYCFADVSAPVENETDMDSAIAIIGTGNLPPMADANGPYTGSVDSAITFDGTASSDPDGSIATYDWDFGDDTTGTGATPSHTYSAAGVYNVTLTVTDDDGAPASDSTAALIGLGAQPPVANANGPYTGVAGNAITFDGTASSDPDGSIVSYEWDFGDDTTGTGATPSHVYATDGIYNVTLTVTDDDSLPNSDDTVAVIGTGNLPPTADANGPYRAEAGEELTFDGTGSTDPDGSIVSYDWDFGDDNNGSGVTPSHTYSAAGVYNVILMVTDDADAINSDGTVAVIALILIDVPDVVGMTQANAEAAIVAGGLSVGTVTTANSDTVSAGDVISQDPTACTKCAAAGDSVDLLVSTGPMPGPAEQIEALIAAVKALGLSKGRTTSLIASLDAALKQVNEGNDKTAINVLGAFINKVEAQAGKSINPSDAEALIAAAEDIIDAINNPVSSVAEATVLAAVFENDSSGGSALGPWSLLLLMGLHLLRGHRRRQDGSVG